MWFESFLGIPSFQILRWRLFSSFPSFYPFIHHPHELLSQTSEALVRLLVFRHQGRCFVLLFFNIYNTFWWFLPVAFHSCCQLVRALPLGACTWTWTKVQVVLLQAVCIVIIVIFIIKHSQNIQKMQASRQGTIIVKKYKKYRCFWNNSGLDLFHTQLPFFWTVGTPQSGQGSCGEPK